MTDYKEFAKQMRENAVKNEQGNIVCSPELWEEIAGVIERAIVPPCKVGDKLYITASISKEIVESVVIGMWIIEDSFSILTIHGTIISDSLGKTVFLTKEEAETELRKRSENNA